MHPIVEAVLFLLHDVEKHAVHPHTSSKAARLIAEINAGTARCAVPDAPAPAAATPEATA